MSFLLGALAGTAAILTSGVAGYLVTLRRVPRNPAPWHD